MGRVEPHVGGAIGFQVLTETLSLSVILGLDPRTHWDARITALRSCFFKKVWVLGFNPRT
jgi:hypothetical protein